MGAVRLALPVALTLWFLWKARENALFLLGIPVLMVMNGSVFFENMTVFWRPARFEPDLLIMAWLTVVWAVTLVRRPRIGDVSLGPFGVGRILPEELALVGIAALIGLHTLAAFANSGDLAHAANLASGTFFLVLGYLMVRGIASRATRAETQEFLGAVVIANTVACGLFVLDQGLHLPIYLGQANITYLYAGQDIMRFDVFAPALNLLALGFVLAKRRWTPGWLVVLAVTLLAILVSLTRTLVVAAVVGVVLSIVVRELSQPDFREVARRLGVIVLAAGVVVLGFSRFIPAYWAFLLKRLGEFATTSQTGRQVQNWHVRMIHLAATQRVVAKGDIMFGLGFLHPGTITVNWDFGHWASDMAWVPILYFFGYVGLALFGLLLMGFLARALSLSLKPPELRRELALAYFITLVLIAIMTLQEWTFMNPGAYPMGLWILALLTAETLRPAEEPALGAASTVVTLSNRWRRDSGQLRGPSFHLAVGVVTASDTPRVTFGIIVLNGEPFTRYCLARSIPSLTRSSCRGWARDILDSATPDGHSIGRHTETLCR